jgi:hypothetical protein
LDLRKSGKLVTASQSPGQPFLYALPPWLKVARKLDKTAGVDAGKWKIGD